MVGLSRVSGFFFAQGLTQLTSGALLGAAPELPGAAGWVAQNVRNGWGCCPGLCLASAKVKLSGKMKRESLTCGEDKSCGAKTAVWQLFYMQTRPIRSSAWTAPISAAESWGWPAACRHLAGMTMSDRGGRSAGRALLSQHLLPCISSPLSSPSLAKAGPLGW